MTADELWIPFKGKAGQTYTIAGPTWVATNEYDADNGSECKHHNFHKGRDDYYCNDCKHRLPVAEPIKRDKPRIGRNEPCPCGSGLKYKRCCAADPQK